MVINNKEDLDALLKYCKAYPYSEVREGGKFYKVEAQDFKYPDGSVQTREYIDKKKSSLVVPITEDGNFVCIIQPIGLAEEGSLIEFPAGYFELGENSKEAGIRELSEETGYVPEEIIPLGFSYQDPGSIRQKVNLFLAMGCRKLNQQNLDKGEFIKYVEIPYEFAMQLLDDGYFLDSNSCIALCKSDRYLQKKYTQKNESNSFIR